MGDKLDTEGTQILMETNLHVVKTTKEIGGENIQRCQQEPSDICQDESPAAGRLLWAAVIEKPHHSQTGPY